MKGIFFTEILEMSESEFGCETVEKVVSLLGAGNNGVYDSMHDYSYKQFDELVSLLSKESRLSKSDVSKNFGEHLFSRLVILYRPEFAGNSDVFEFLEQIDYFIHVKMQERFPHKGLKGFKAERIDDSTFIISYESKKVFVDLAIGMFMGCQRFFNEDLTLSCEYIANVDKDVVRFTLSKNSVLI